MAQSKDKPNQGMERREIDPETEKGVEAVQQKYPNAVVKSAKKQEGEGGGYEITYVEQGSDDEKKVTVSKEGKVSGS